MAYLLDTNILVRLANGDDNLHPVAAKAIFALHRNQETLYLTPQNYIEFASVSTRPTKVNGLGLGPNEVQEMIATFESIFPILPETENIYPAWKSITRALGVIGKQVHDARLVAVCHAHQVTHLLTFNVSHFARFATFGPGIQIIDPASI
jgi:predicted nucleic acid-binding protein